MINFKDDVFLIFLYEKYGEIFRKYYFFSRGL